MNLFKHFIIFLIFSSCSGHILLHPKGCKGSAYWSDEKSSQKNQNFEIQEKIWLAQTQKEVRIIDVLREKNISCEKIESLTYELSSTKGDALISLLPFFSRKTLTLKGKFK